MLAVKVACLCVCKNIFCIMYISLCKQINYSINLITLYGQITLAGFTRLENWKGKYVLDSRIFGIHNHLVLRKRRKGYLHIRLFLVFILHSNTHTHTHNTTCTTYTFLSNKASDPKAGHRDSQPNLFLRKGRKTLLL